MLSYKLALQRYILNLRISLPLAAYYSYLTVALVRHLFQSIVHLLYSVTEVI